MHYRLKTIGKIVERNYGIFCRKQLTALPTKYVTLVKIFKNIVIQLFIIFSFSPLYMFCTVSSPPLFHSLFSDEKFFLPLARICSNEAILFRRLSCLDILLLLLFVWQVILLKIFTFFFASPLSGTGSFCMIWRFKKLNKLRKKKGF